MVMPATFSICSRTAARSVSRFACNSVVRFSKSAIRCSRDSSFCSRWPICSSLRSSVSSRFSARDCEALTSAKADCISRSSAWRRSVAAFSACNSMVLLRASACARAAATTLSASLVARAMERVENCFTKVHMTPAPRAGAARTIRINSQTSICITAPPRRMQRGTTQADIPTCRETAVDQRLTMNQVPTVPPAEACGVRCSVKIQQRLVRYSLIVNRNSMRWLLCCIEQARGS